MEPKRIELLIFCRFKPSKYPMRRIEWSEYLSGERSQFFYIVAAELRSTNFPIKKPSEARFLRAGVPENRHVVILARD
jgi:hypothetical protein